MKPIFTFFLAILSIVAQAQDTFSIVAVDTTTGEFGSAGASCLDDNDIAGGAIIISDILPGRGVIHTQSYWSPINQANARARMEEGLSPEEILQWLKTNDPNGPIGAQSRQYGIVDVDPQGHPRAAAFTGNGCLNWKGHRLGTYYSIQGNILLGPEILDSMEVRFLNATGTLAERLMAALQGANVPGADSRCLSNGTSSLSAFVRVARTDDEDDNLYLDLNVSSVPAGMEPIDSLQTLFNQWLQSTSTTAPQNKPVRMYPNPADGKLFIEFLGETGRLEMYSTDGQLTHQQPLFFGLNVLQPNLPHGFYMVRIIDGSGTMTTRKIVWKKS
ncbi:MAG: DUF1028 domain-containing protein [Saprospiraceae bacterium]|nr:DUF1028 domain-containing protein [Saprospiraceae bacterium]